MPFRCLPPDKYFSNRTGTVMADSKFGYQTWALAIYLFSTCSKGIFSMKLHRELGISQKSAWHLGHRLRAGFASPSGLLASPDEEDEIFVGGKARNKHQSQKLLAERGPVCKQQVAEARDRRSGRTTAAPVEDAGELRQGFVASYARAGAAVDTDEAAAYAWMPEYAHEAVNIP